MSGGENDFILRFGASGVKRIHLPPPFCAASAVKPSTVHFHVPPSIKEFGVWEKSLELCIVMQLVIEDAASLTL